ncbi:U3 small nucleolar RNA-associated protein 15 homolog [Episyrphus balteatus]|uniref:U3 small nucleolar RNA-associated protein 15 homolog n=1 Tax=Episyrphus balteatus TaxID=286459 RepID=UPI002485D05D|nr:U3 small nucleolar RNA-associated protein 15 homolog [Episyrphus balteatus]
MSNFKPLDIKKFQKQSSEVTADSLYWKNLSVPTLVKEFGAIDYIDFSPVQPHYFAVTCSVRVQIYNPITKLVAKNLSKFQENAYGGSFRQDGRLLVAGDEQGSVKLFDTSSKNVLRLFKGHKAPTHRTFFTPDLLHIASFSDDKTFKLWDIGSEKVVHTYSDHSDYIRAGCVNPASSNIVVSGGYDKKINFYDTRTQQVAFSVNHESAVESLLFLPTGGIFISAGGTEVCVWDVFAGGKLLTKLSQHHKTVTCLRLASNGKRIMSGGLDRHVKIYDVASYQTVSTLSFPNSVLSLAVAPKDQTVVAGMVDGMISIQNMEENKSQKKEKSKYNSKFRSVDHDIITTKRIAEASYDYHLRTYKYAQCLDDAMKNCVKTPEITVSVMQELIHRKGLQRALAGRTHSSLARIILFVIKNIGEHRFLRVLIDVGMILLDVYEDKFHEFTGKLGKQFIQLANILQKEVALTHDLLELQGALELLVAVSSVSSDDRNDNPISFLTTDKCPGIKQSEMAKESSIVIV